jgi:hypothetical protein
MIDNAVGVFGVTGTFILILIVGLIYLTFNLGKKQVPDSYDTNKVQCDIYSDSMNKRKNIMGYQVLQLTHVNKKALSTNCTFWKPKNKCELTENGKCKFFS